MKKETLKIEIGDCFAYEIKNDSKLKGRYFILCCRGLPYKKEVPYIYDFFLLKITKNNKLPKTKEEIDILENVIVSATTMAMRFFPFTALRPFKEQMEEKRKVKVYPDEYGLLHTYTFKMKITRWKDMNKLIYLGNFDIKEPKKEFLPFDVINMSLVVFKYMEEDLLMYYHSYNLKEANIWHQDNKTREAIDNLWIDIVNTCDEKDPIYKKNSKLK